MFCYSLLSAAEVRFFYPGPSWWERGISFCTLSLKNGETFEAYGPLRVSFPSLFPPFLASNDAGVRRQLWAAIF